MGRRTEFWCDECGDTMPRVNVQWSACPANRWHTRDFCGYPCAEKFKARALEHEDHGRGITDGGPYGSDCGCRTTDKQPDCAKAGCGFCLGHRP